MRTVALHLSDADRERLGCGDWMPVDLGAVTARQAATLQRRIWPGEDGEMVGFDEPDVWREGLRGVPVFDGHGAPVMVDDADGDGQVQHRRAHIGAEMAWVWLALAQNGIRVDPTELDYNRDAVRYIVQADPDAKPEAESEGPGKDDAPVEPQTTSNS
jgi:hypothetical protein